MMNALGHKGSFMLANSHKPAARVNVREGMPPTHSDGFNIHYFEESLHPDHNLQRIPIDTNVEIDVPDDEKVSLATVKHPKQSVTSTREKPTVLRKKETEAISSEQSEPDIQAKIETQIQNSSPEVQSLQAKEIKETKPCAEPGKSDQTPDQKSEVQESYSPDRIVLAAHQEYGALAHVATKHSPEQFESEHRAEVSSSDEDELMSGNRQPSSTRVHRMNTPSVRDKSGAQSLAGAGVNSSRMRGTSASNVSRATVSGKVGSTDWKNLPLDPPPLIIERAPMKRVSQPTSGSQISGIFYFYQTVESTSLVEVLHKKKSEVVGSPNARVIYWKKSKSLVLDEGQLHKISLKDMKKSRFGVELSKVGFHGLKHFQTVIVKEKLYVIGGIRDYKASRSCFEIDLKNRTVFNIPNLPFEQMNQILVAVDRSMFYCFGEIDPSGEFDGVSAKFANLLTGPVYGLFSYNTESRVWTILSALHSEFAKSSKSASHSASSRALRSTANLEEMPFSPSYMVSDKHFLFVVDRQNPQLVAKYSIAEDRWVKDLLKDKHSDLGRFDTVCMANAAKHSVVLGAAVSNTSDVDLVTLELLTNKLLKYTQLSVPDSLLPLVLVPLSKVRY